MVRDAVGSMRAMKNVLRDRPESAGMASVYMAKSRVGRLMRREVSRLRKSKSMNQ